MKITPSNYLTTINKIGVSKLPPALKEFHRIITEDFPSIAQFQKDFEKEADIKADFQEYFDALEKKYADVLKSKNRGAKVISPPKTVKSKTGKKIREAMQTKASDQMYERKKMSSRLLKFIPEAQKKAVWRYETPAHNQIVNDLNKKVAEVPKLYTYEKELSKAKKQNKAIKMDSIYQAHLHYFNASSDWYICEYDEKEGLFFGWAILNGDEQNAEYGYISIAELTANYGFGKSPELDFHFTPKTMDKVKNPTESSKRKKRSRTSPNTKKSITVKTGTKIRASMAQKSMARNGMSQKAKEKDCDCEEKDTHKAKSNQPSKPHQESKRTKSHQGSKSPITKPEKGTHKRKSVKPNTAKGKTEKKETEVPKTTPKAKATRGNTEKISPEVKFIKRFVNLQGDTKTQSQIQAFIRDLQKAITERAITKNSKYAKEVMEVQDALLLANDICKDKSDTIKFDIKESLFDKLKAIASGDVIYWEVYYAKRIINLQGNETKAKAGKLKKEIDAKIKDGAIKESHKPYHNFKKLYSKLVAYLESSSKLAITQQELYGITNHFKQKRNGTSKKS